SPPYFRPAVASRSSKPDHPVALVVLSSSRVNGLLIALALVVPAISFVGAAWESRIQIMREGEDTILHSLAAIRDHVQTVFQAEERVLFSVDDHIRGLSWEEIAKPETAAFLRSLTTSSARVESIWIADREGVIRAASRSWEAGARITDQEFFQAQRG